MTVGFSAGGGFGSACFGSARLGAAAVAREIDGGAGLLAALGLAGGGALAVVSEPPSPTLRARLEKKLSERCSGSRWAGVAEATRVAGAETADRKSVV